MQLAHRLSGKRTGHSIDPGHFDIALDNCCANAKVIAKLWGLAVNSSLDTVLVIYEAVLQLTFEESQNDHGHLLPATALEMLSEKLNASGGNFSIYNAQDNSLDVRARYPLTASGLSFREFGERMALIGRDGALNLRAKSSSYRCLDGKSAVLVPRSDLLNPDRMTLDVRTLEPEQDQSAAAVPFFAHEQCIGVLHMDSTDYREKTFTEGDLDTLGNLARLLGPVVFNSLLTEAVGHINRLILTSNDGEDRRKIIDGVCRELSKILFMPWVGLYQRHPNRALFQLKGENRSFGAGGSSDLASFRWDDLVAASDSHETDETETTSFIDLSDAPISTIGALAGNSTFLLALRDPANKVSGFLLLADPGQRVLSEGFKRMSMFLAALTNLSLNALLQFEARSGENYENAAHTFTRNLGRIDGAKTRIDTALRVMRQAANTRQESGLVDIRSELNRLRAPMGALESNIAESRETLLSLLKDPQYRQYRGKISMIGTKGESDLVTHARMRHFAYLNQSNPPPLDLRTELEDMLNNGTKAMNRKNVRWSRDFEPMPRDLRLEPTNFRNVLGNVIDNAIKYARPNTVIKIEVRSGDFRGTLRITNTGPHIDIHGTEGDDIFLRSFRGEMAEVAGHAGLGIGLWEADQISRLWGGRPLRLLHSEPLGQGENWSRICFQLSIPYDRVSKFRI